MKLNRVELAGNVGNIDIYESEGKTPFAKVSLAENNRYLNKAGETVQQTTWHTVVFYDKQVEAVKSAVSKGCQLFIIGRLSYHNWQTEAGENRQSACIVANQFQVVQHSKQSENKETAEASKTEAEEMPS